MLQRPWLRALAWLAFLGPFFFLTYDFANAAAANRAHVPTLMFRWERHIPFIDWTILPYWSSDILYALALVVCRTRAELDLHAKRLLAIQVFCIACFIVFPLRCAFIRPSVAGWEAPLFKTLYTFDQPFNQAPSLHVALALILWTRFRPVRRKVLRAALAAWLFLVVMSTLTTWQHHFIDIPTGAWAGLLVLAALPEKRVAPPQAKLALVYLAGSALLTIAAFVLRGWGWLFLWPAFALSMAASAYWTGDPAWLAKVGAARLFLLPYTFCAWTNSRLWTRGQPPSNCLPDAVWIGRAPSRRERSGMLSVVTLAPELAVRGDAHIPMLDWSPPSVQQLDAAVEAIMNLASHRPTLVCCALGYSRSAIVTAAWLLATGYAANIDDALRQIRKARPQIVIRPNFRRALEQWVHARTAVDQKR